MSLPLRAIVRSDQKARRGQSPFRIGTQQLIVVTRVESWRPTLLVRDN